MLVAEQPGIAKTVGREIAHESADLTFQVADLDGVLANPAKLGQSDTTSSALG